jgi:hypothetical protein
MCFTNTEAEDVAVFEGRELLNTPTQPKKQTTADSTKKTSPAKPQERKTNQGRLLLQDKKAAQQKQATRPAAAATTKATAAKPQEKKPKRALLGELTLCNRMCACFLLPSQHTAPQIVCQHCQHGIWCVSPN